MFTPRSVIGVIIQSEQVKLGVVAKIFRKLDLYFDISELRDRIANFSPVVEFNTACNNMQEFLSKLHVVRNVCTELQSNSIDVSLTAIGEESAPSMQDFDDFIAFHESYQPPESQNVTKFLTRLDSTDWTCGAQLDETDKAVTLADCGDIETIERDWLYVTVGAINSLKQDLTAEGLHHCCVEPLYASLMPRIRTMAERQLENVRCVRITRESLLDSVCGLVALACAEIHFERFEAKSVAVPWTKWLERGFVPCGWVGSYPDGNIVLTTRDVEKSGV